MKGANHQLHQWTRRGGDHELHNQSPIVRVVPYVLILVLLFLTVPLISSRSFASDPVLERIRKERAQGWAKGYLAEGKSALKRNDNIRAVRVLSDAIRLGAVPDALKFRGKAQANLGETAAALRDLSSYLSANPLDSQAHTWRGDVHFTRREFARAIEDYSAALAGDRTKLDVYRARGAAYIACEDYEKARTDLETVLRANPQDVEALTNLAVACKLSGMSDAAKHFFERALASETDPSWTQEVRAQLTSLASQKPICASNDGVSAFLSWGPEETGSTRNQAKADDVAADNTRPAARVHAVPSEVSGKAPTRVMQPQRVSLVAPKHALADISGRWDTTYMGHSISMAVKQRDTRLTGTLTIRSPSGKEDSYHFQGTFDGTNVVASHHDGNSFRGKLTNGRLVGVLSTRHGRSFDVNMSR